MCSLDDIDFQTFKPKIRSALAIMRYNEKITIGSTPGRALEIHDPTGHIFQIFLFLQGNKV